MSFFTASARKRSFAIPIAMFAAALAPSAALASSEHLGDRTLKQGDSGHDVRVLQGFLTEAGFKTPVVGDFGPVTLKNVERFQKAEKLKPADGIVDAAVVTKLRAVVGEPASTSSSSTGASTPATTPVSATTPAATTPAVYPGGSKHLGDRLLKKGLNGHDVRVLQAYLTTAGFPTTVDGSFGAGTAKVVKAFEKANRLPVDGVVNATVASTLRTIVEGGAATVGTTPSPAAPAGAVATLNPDGTANAPAAAPAAVKAVIAAGNKIASTPYLWGGGHGSWTDSGYDCSGSVSFALHGGGLISSPEDSGTLESYGQAGKGTWITIWANAGHTYMEVAGLRFDTSGADPSRWQTDSRSGSGYVVRHPTGY